MSTSAAPSALRFPYAEPPASGEIREVAPGVGWLRLPLPFALNHINVWILSDTDGVTLVDTGMNTDATTAIWEDLFNGVLKGLPVKQVICTHYHPDHMGLSVWLTERTGAPLRVTAEEFAIAHRLFGLDPNAFTTLAVAAYRRAGVPEETARAFHTVRTGRIHLYPLPKTADFIDPDALIEAGGTHWRVVIGRGHSPQLAALYSPEHGVLISGDQVLPGISPNVSVLIDDPEANPLRLFLESLQKFRELPPDTFVLPSHKLPFYGLHTRIDDLTAHHAGRLNDVRMACARPVTAAAVMAIMFPRQLDAHQTFFAVGETLAHLNYLIGTGEIVRTTDGVRDIYRTA